MDKRSKYRFVVFSLGGNIGNVMQSFNISQALINEKIGEIQQVSSIYETQAWGMEDDTPNFLNQVVTSYTTKSAEQVLKITQDIEQTLGRTQKSTNLSYANRPIDIDILFYDYEIIDKPNLKIPHKEIIKRRFVLEPLNEIMPQYIHPEFNQSINTLLKNCPDTLPVNKL